MLTIETWLNGVGRKQPIDECPYWPPDLFAIAGTLLKRSGAYLKVFQDGPSSYLDDVESVATAWRQGIDGSKDPVDASRLLRQLPKSIAASWKILVRELRTPISDIRHSDSLAQHLLRMTLIADEASTGIGIDWRESDGNAFLLIADAVLVSNELRSFCWDVPTDTICVLGKQHTPQKGATFRSLSHHLSLYLPNDIEARWVSRFPHPAHSIRQREMLNLLLLPWPIRMGSEDFAEVPNPLRRSVRSRNRAAYFRFHPRRNLTRAEFSRRLTQAIEKGREHAREIDAIVLPELALTWDQYEEAERIAFDAGIILICGVRRKGSSSSSRDSNLSVLQPAGRLRGPGSRKTKALLASERLMQAKHHRWHLDREQVVSYQLSGRLPLPRGCWEYIELFPRLINFLTLNQITWSVLVCEDLARQDPAADLIRAVGPNLLIALLMDGPQLSGRWPSRYASVLADDPGTSVLTLTSLGMAERCRPIMRATNRRADASRVIALWRDAVSGEVEIALDDNDDACVLTLENRRVEELSADGRSDGSARRSPTFAGFRSFRTEA